VYITRHFQTRLDTQYSKVASFFYVNTPSSWFLWFTNDCHFEFPRTNLLLWFGLYDTVSASFIFLFLLYISLLQFDSEYCTAASRREWNRRVKPSSLYCRTKRSHWTTRRFSLTLLRFLKPCCRSPANINMCALSPLSFIVWYFISTGHTFLLNLHYNDRLVIFLEVDPVWSVDHNTCNIWSW